MTMIYQTFSATLHPDGKVTLPLDQLPPHPVRVLVTIMQDSEDALLTELGDYQQQLMDYEERLARGEVRWQ
jgi:hypothetical protein